MKNSSLINQIFLTQRDIFKTYKDNNEVKEDFNDLLVTEKKFLEAIKGNTTLCEMYEDLDEAQTQYLSSTEKNAFFHGFKTGLNIAIEAVADKFIGDID